MTTETSCPSWCTTRHGQLVGDDDEVHVGPPVQIRGTVLRLCLGFDPMTGGAQGPYVLVGPAEYTLHEAEQLTRALAMLIDTARSEEQPTPRRTVTPAGA